MCLSGFTGTGDAESSLSTTGTAAPSCGGAGFVGPPPSLMSGSRAGVGSRGAVDISSDGSLSLISSRSTGAGLGLGLGLALARGVGWEAPPPEPSSAKYLLNLCDALCMCTD